MSLEERGIADSVGNAYRNLDFCPDTLIICPLNETHIIPWSDMESHLERCLIGDLIEMTCPWNYHHIVDETSYENHIHVCEDKRLEIVSDQLPEN